MVVIVTACDSLPYSSRVTLVLPITAFQEHAHKKRAQAQRAHNMTRYISLAYAHTRVQSHV